jgi:hypothetical protein
MTRRERKQQKKVRVYKEPKKKVEIIDDVPREASGYKFFIDGYSGCFVFGGYAGEIVRCSNCIYENSCIKKVQWIFKNGKVRRALWLTGGD